MAIQLTIAGTTFNYPESGTNPNWAEEASSWAVAVTEALNTLIAPGDILTTTFNIENNVSLATNINGLIFDAGTTRAANVTYSIYRTSTATPAGNAETGTLYLIYDTNASVGSKWQMTQQKNGNSGVTFSIGDSGQITFVSNDIGSTGYSGTIKFSARTLSV